MKRYNIFYQVHKGLRELLYQTASRLQQTDFIQQEEADEILAQINEVLDLFDKHAHTEDNFVLSAIEEKEPAVANMFEAEHVMDHALANRLRSLVNMFHHTVSTDERNELASAIRFSYIEFMVFNLNHMGKEESELNLLLWKHFSDETLHGITQQILSHLSPDAMLRFSRWMLRGLSNTEIIAWLKQVKNSAPDAAFNGMLQMAEKELPVQRWSLVQEGITEGAMLV